MESLVCYFCLNTIPLNEGGIGFQAVKFCRSCFAFRRAAVCPQAGSLCHLSCSLNGIVFERRKEFRICGDDSSIPCPIGVTDMKNSIAFKNLGTVAKCLFSVALVFAVCLPALAQQEDAATKARQRQTKMMETQMFMSQLMQLGFNSDLREELEVVDDQVEDVKKLAQNYQKEIMEFHMENRKYMEDVQKLYQEGKHKEAQKISEEFQEKNDALSQRYMDRAAETLLPHQMRRLQQIARQQRVKSVNQFSDEFGVAASLADELGLSAAEKKRLIDTIKEARKEYYETVAVAKKKANEKIMGALTTEQKEKMKEMLGESYDQQEGFRRMQQKQRKAMTK